MGPFGWCFTLVWMLGRALSLAHEATPERLEPGTMSATSVEPRNEDALLPAEGACDVLWTSWPQVQERAINDGTVMVWDMKTPVGNLMRTLTFILPLARLLEVGFIINLEHFPAFRVAFEPALIKWDFDPDPFVQMASETEKGVDPTGRHTLRFGDGFMILSDSQLELLAVMMDVGTKSHAEIKRIFREDRWTKWRDYLPQAKLAPASPCAWNMLLRRSPAMMASMEAHSPWDSTWDPFGAHRRYNAWHIRTPDGESVTSFQANVHKYIFHGRGSAEVCPFFLSTVSTVNNACPNVAPVNAGSVPVYISSNSKSMALNCSIMAKANNVKASFVDLGEEARASHNANSTNPNVTVNAFVDFLQLMDASVVVRTSSSLATAVTEMKGYHCAKLKFGGRRVKKMYMCSPEVC